MRWRPVLDGGQQLNADPVGREVRRVQAQPAVREVRPNADLVVFDALGAERILHHPLAVGVLVETARIEPLGVADVKHHVLGELPTARRAIGVGGETNVPDAGWVYETVVDTAPRELEVGARRFVRRDSGGDAGGKIEGVLVGRLLVMPVAEDQIKRLAEFDVDFAEDCGAVDVVAAQGITSGWPRAAGEHGDPVCGAREAIDEAAWERPAAHAVDIECSRERWDVTRRDARSPTGNAALCRCHLARRAGRWPVNPRRRCRARDEGPSHDLTVVRVLRLEVGVAARGIGGLRGTANRRARYVGLAPVRHRIRRVTVATRLVPLIKAADPSESIVSARELELVAGEIQSGQEVVDVEVELRRVPVVVLPSVAVRVTQEVLEFDLVRHLDLQIRGLLIEKLTRRYGDVLAPLPLADQTAREAGARVVAVEPAAARDVVRQR